MVQRKFPRRVRLVADRARAGDPSEACEYLEQFIFIDRRMINRSVNSPRQRDAP